MGGFWANLGFLAVCFVIVFGCKKHMEHVEVERMSRHADARVYEAASAFVRGEGDEARRVMLEGSTPISSQAADSILDEASCHRGDADGGYRAFLRAVNAALGDLCDERHRPSL